MSKVLSVDTSNYTTSACIYDSEKGLLWENRIMLKVADGACGIRQNDAVFLHNRNLSVLFENVPKCDIDFYAASKCPSEKENSYMPCFTVGISYATAMSKIFDKQLFLCSHQKNHIAAALVSGGCSELLKCEFIAYHISGGTTDILLCRPCGNDFSVIKIGGTADISCGQLIDRIGNMLNFDFPCGKEIEKNSNSILTGKIRFAMRDGLYNFSGFQNKAAKLHEKNSSVDEICTYALDVVYSFLKTSITNLRDKYGDLPIVLSGGVMSNRIIASHILSEFENIFFSDPHYSVDNAIGTAYLCLHDKGLV